MRLVLLLLLLGWLSACAQAEPFSYVAADEIPPGPGLLSGEKGAFTLFQR